MSGAAPGAEEAVRSALPIADLSVIDEALPKGLEAVRAAVKRVRPADLGRDLSRRKGRDAKMLVEASEDRRAAMILRSAHPTVAANVLKECSPEHAARLLTFLPSDHQTAILAAMSPAARRSVEDSLPAEDREIIQRLLQYPEAVVGRLMTPKVWRCDESATVLDALAILRSQDAAIEVAQNCYVVAGKKLVGVVALRELAVSLPETRVKDLMRRDVIAVTEDAERGDAAEIIQIHDFLSLPITDKAGNLVGAVRVDDLLDAALAKVGAGILNQGGVAGNLAAQLPYFQTPLYRVVRSRLTWLVLLFVAETLTGTVLRSFEDELAKVVALSFFVPLLIGTGGNAGSQTVSTIIRALALGEVRVSDMLRVVSKEVMAGVSLGVLLGLIAFGRALLWGVGKDLAACVATTIFVVCTWATTVGAVIPLAAQRMRIDPTVVSGPLITTLVDASGLFIYFTVARLMIAQLH